MIAFGLPKTVSQYSLPILTILKLWYLKTVENLRSFLQYLISTFFSNLEFECHLYDIFLFRKVVYLEIWLSLRFCLLFLKKSKILRCHRRSYILSFSSFIILIIISRRMNDDKPLDSFQTLNMKCCLLFVNVTLKRNYRYCSIIKKFYKITLS